MGILSLLRNAFGRGRKGRPDEAETADQLPTPRQEHDLVTAAFDTPRVPAQGAVREETEPPKTDSTATPDTAAPQPETSAAAESPEAKAPATPEAPAEVKTPETETTPASETPAEVETPETETPASVESADTAISSETEAPKTESAPVPVTEAPATAETAPAAEAPVAAEPEAPQDEAKAETAEAPEEQAAEPDPLAMAAPAIEPLMMEPAIIDADPEVVVPQQRTEPLPEAEAEHDQPAIPEQPTEPSADALTEPETPDPTPAAEPAPNAEPTPAPTPEAKAEPEPEAKAEPEAKPAPEAEPTPAPAPKAQAEPEAKVPAEPEPKAKAEPEPEAKPKSEPEATAGPEAATTPAPEAADAPAPPQAAPAPDNASRTGGAGGNTTEAEGAAEAEPLADTPSAEAEPPAHTPSAEAEPPADTPSAAAATLTKTNLTGQTAKLYLVLDRSSSMRPYYKDGSAQALADQTLALAAHLDEDPTVHVVFFSTEVDGTTDLTLTEDHTAKIDETHATLGRMGRTSYHAAVEAVLAHHDKHHTPEDNALVVFQTDGAPDAKTPATLALTNAAKSHPRVFFSFVAFGDPDSKAFDYLRRLRTANTSFFHAGPTPRELTDTELYEGVLAAWRP
ncbi:VWA domain-containing protein [Streptomyces sp. NPDC090119]|uniref:VWA domain-containing protein n=1 Tax=Streptomyces sp. NPDC090119 TaxID=3365951 RepID=UPI0037FE2F31